MRITIVLDVDASQGDAIEIAEGLSETVRAAMGLQSNEFVLIRSSVEKDGVHEMDHFYPVGTDW